MIAITDRRGGFVAEAELPDHLEAVAARHALHAADGQQALKARAAAINAKVPGPIRKRLMLAAVGATKVSQRVHWLRRATDQVLDAAQGQSACRKGCNHCCHIGVHIPEPEARVIAAEIGRPLAQPSADRILAASASLEPEAIQATLTKQQALSDLHAGTPCPFLVDSACSIYAHRPLACRQLINVDDDDLLCRLVPGTAVTVPYLDLRDLQMGAISALGVRMRIADIRDWFPTT